MTEYQFPLRVGGEWVANETALLTGVESGTMMRSEESVRYLIVHCTATRPTLPYPPEQLRRDHQRRGFRTIGYHFYIRTDGSVTQHRRLLEVGAHCRPFNRCSIGICYEGGLDAKGRPADTRTLAQRAALRGLLAQLHALFPQAVVRGHRDMPGATPKACPCFDATAEYRDITHE